jgi:hypothetical protein
VGGQYWTSQTKIFNVLIKSFLLGRVHLNLERDLKSGSKKTILRTEAAQIDEVFYQLKKNHLIERYESKR